jgi:hypothetical protein
MFNGYNVALFLHICGAAALFSVIALLLGGMAGARRAGSVRSLLEQAQMADRMRWVLPICAVLLFAAASYMVSDRSWWQRQWVGAAMVTIILIVALHLAVIAPRLAAVVRTAKKAPDGAPPRELRRLVNDPLLWLAAQAVSTLATGAIALMVFKPGGAGSLAIVLIAAALGVLSGMPALARARRITAEA